MSSRNERDHARLLLMKAGDDEAALHALGDNPSVADSIVGFHAQAARRLVGAVRAWAEQLVEGASRRLPDPGEGGANEPGTAR